MRRQSILILLLAGGLALLACGGKSQVTLPPERCGNGVDDDLDGHVDCADQDCHADPACGTQPVEDCANGLDDDGDEFTDCEDQDCWTHPACDEEPPVEDCDNDLDDDGDGAVDCADADCDGDPACDEEPPVEDCDNDLDDDGDGAVDCADADCDGDPACQITLPELCADGVDNDGDGALDCADADCAVEPDCFDYTGGVGAACRASAECAQVPSGVCRTELGDGLPGGYCSATCSIMPGVCPAGSACVTDSNGVGYCGKTCASGADCRAGYACTTPSGSSASVCTPYCRADWQCRDTRYCSTNSRTCTAQELCTTPADDDNDGQVNCADTNCAGSTACGCVEDDRLNVQWSSAFELDLADPTPLAGAICGPTYQDWFVFTPAATASHVFTATFSNAAGDLDLYLYAADSLGSALAYAYTTSDTEVITHTLTAGVTYYLLVAGYHRAATTYTLAVTRP